MLYFWATPQQNTQSAETHVARQYLAKWRTESKASTILHVALVTNGNHSVIVDYFLVYRLLCESTSTGQWKLGWKIRKVKDEKTSNWAYD